jgi:broad specificity phosphatase PhoE
MLSKKATEKNSVSTLYLVRHGENLANITKELSCRKVDYPLTSKGRLQAEQTRAVFNGANIDAIYASPLKRASETAQIIASGTGLQVEIMENFRELNFGDLEDLGNSSHAWEIHFQVIKDWMTGKPNTSFPGGEDYFTARQRLRQGVETILKNSVGRRIVIVGHGGLFSTGLLDLCPTTDPSILWRKEVHNCSISEIAMQKVNGQWVGELIRWADTTHLSSEAADLISGLPPAWDAPLSRFSL